MKRKNVGTVIVTLAACLVAGGCGPSAEEQANADKMVKALGQQKAGIQPQPKAPTGGKVDVGPGVKTGQ